MAARLLSIYKYTVLCNESNARLWRRCFSCTPMRRNDVPMNDPLEHATGIEKRELLAKAAGNKDPYGVETILKRSKGTKDCPTTVPSCFEGRIVGCLCDEEARSVSWMWLEKGCPKRCACGFWFKLVETKPL